MLSTYSLLIALILYGIGSIAVLIALNGRSRKLEAASTVLMIAGLVAHTIWIGTICVRTGHPPLTNLSEITGFLAWTVLSIKLLLQFRFRVDAASFFLYPLVFLLLLVSALVGQRYVALGAEARSVLFVGHLLVTTLGMAAMVIGTVFTWLYHVHQHYLKSKRPGRLYDWIPSLQLCDFLSFRGLAIGFTLYTVGIIAGVLWAYRSVGDPFSLRAKELGAILAWLLFAALLQSYINGSFRLRRNLIVSFAAVFALAISLTGISHV